LPKPTEPTAAQKENAAPVYQAAELAGSALKLFGVTPDLAGAALKLSGKSAFTVEGAKEIITEFMQRKVT